MRKANFCCIFVSIITAGFFEILTNKKVTKMKQAIKRVWEYSQNNSHGFTLNIETFKPIKFGICVAYLETQNCFGRQGLEQAINHAFKHNKIIGGWLNDETNFFTLTVLKFLKV